jgi:diguanylate cyclase (GGDEF)-like protein
MILRDRRKHPFVISLCQQDAVEMNNILLLKRAELFSTLLDHDLEFIATRIEEKTYKKEEVVFQSGAAAIHFYIVKSGQIVITQVAGDKRIDLARYGSGDSFGEFDFINNALYDVNAYALEKSRLIVFPAFPHTFDSLTNERPDIMTRLFLNAIVILSNRLRSIHNLISENTLWIKHLQEQLFTDHLTGLYTNVYLKTEIARLIAPPVVFIVIKPDRFKQLNDIFGHKAGDAVLARIGAALQAIIEKKAAGWAVRLRSNEIVLILKQTELEKAVEVARFLETTFHHIGPGQIYASTSNMHKKEEFRLTATIAIGICRQYKQNWRKVLSATYSLMKRTWIKGGNTICVLENHDIENSKKEKKAKIPHEKRP